MTAVSELRATLTAQGLTGPLLMRCEDLLLVMDKAWSPYIQAEAVVPYSAEAEEALNPRYTINGRKPRVIVEVARLWFDGGTLADTTAEWPSGTLGDISAAWASGTLADTTAEWGTEWESGYRAPDVLTVDLAVRALRIDYGAGTLTVRAASDELLAQEARVQIDRPAESCQSRILAVLRAAGVEVPRYDFGGLYYESTEAASFTWDQGVYDVLEAMAVAKGYHLFVDADRTWKALQPDVTFGGIVTLDRVSSAVEDCDTDGDYADAIVLTLKGKTPAGVELEATHVYPDPIPRGSAVATVTQDYGTVTALPTGEALEDLLVWMLGKAQAAGRVMTATAVADPTLRPRTQVSVEVPGAPVSLAVADRVEWSIPADTMTVTTTQS